MTTFTWSMIGWALGWVAFGRIRYPVVTKAPIEPPAMAIVIPARNEERRLPLLLSDLAGYRPPGSRVIVVDDASTDGTAEVAAEHDFVAVVRTEDPPPGWFGKPWACQTGADLTDTPLLCFLDADVRVLPGTLELLADRALHRGGLVSMQPWHATERAYEQASALFNVISVMGVGMGAGITGRPAAPVGAFGPMMATMRSDYDHVGGHAAVAAEVVEDIALAEVYREHDREVTLLPGRGLASYRMYPDGIGSLVEGWSKNFVLGARATPLPVMAMVFVWLATMGNMAGYLAEGLSGGVGLWGPAVAWAAFTTQLRSMFRVVGSFGWLTALLFPLLLAVFFLVFFRSLWLTLVRRQVRWRGRSLPLGSDP